MRSWAGRELLMNWGSWNREKKNFDHKSFKNEKLSLPTRSAPVSCLWIALFNKRGSEKLQKRELSNCRVCFQAAAGACLWVTEWPNVFTLVRAWGCECLFNCSVSYKEPHRQRQTLPVWVQQVVIQWGWVRPWWRLRRSHTYSNTDILVLFFVLLEFKTLLCIGLIHFLLHFFHSVPENLTSICERRKQIILTDTKTLDLWGEM